MDNTNPDLVDVADEAFGAGLPTQVPPFISIPVIVSPNNADGGVGNTRPTVIDQEILVGPTQVHRLNLNGGDSSVTKVVVDQEIQVGPAQTAGTNVNGGTFNPANANVTNTQQNNVVGQTYGTGTPANVFV
jgi:hypothetical protein